MNVIWWPPRKQPVTWTEAKLISTRWWCAAQSLYYKPGGTSSASSPRKTSTHGWKTGTGEIAGRDRERASHPSSNTWEKQMIHQPFLNNAVMDNPKNMEPYQECQREPELMSKPERVSDGQGNSRTHYLIETVVGFPILHSLIFIELCKKTRGTRKHPFQKAAGLPYSPHPLYRRGNRMARRDNERWRRQYNRQPYSFYDLLSRMRLSPRQGAIHSAGRRNHAARQFQFSETRLAEEWNIGEKNPQPPCNDGKARHDSGVTLLKPLPSLPWPCVEEWTDFQNFHVVNLVIPPWMVFETASERPLNNILSGSGRHAAGEVKTSFKFRDMPRYHLLLVSEAWASRLTGSLLVAALAGSHRLTLYKTTVATEDNKQETSFPSGGSAALNTSEPKSPWNRNSTSAALPPTESEADGKAGGGHGDLI